MSRYYCTRCLNDKDEGCGMPDYKVAVPSEDGIRMLTPACPLALKPGFNFKSLFSRMLRDVKSRPR